MATGISSRSFISVIKRSGVVSEAELNKALADLQERGELALEDSHALAKAMIEQGIITRWQAEKLLQGKHKGFFLGPYRLLDMLGRGGMGAVYLAEHTLMRRRCAIKVLPTKNIGSRSYLERFYREAQAVAAMDHKNIVRAYDVNQAKVGEADVHFLAMEFVEGRDLQRMVDEEGVLAFSQAAEYVRQAAEGLAHAHEVNMVHRDIKPANLLVNSKGVVKILDLGLAKFYDEQQQESASLTVAHNETVLGTADYLAPEQAVDSHNTDHRADIYSLGCTFYFLLTGHPPFCEGSVANRLLHHQMKPPPPIRDDRPDAPESLLVIIDRMMAKNREERYQSAKDVADDLAVWLVENGNEEWRERNPELVRKVGESWRADTKVVSGALVDTAELDLKSDDDLSLAPLEESGTPKESPLVSSAAEAEQNSDLDLAPHVDSPPSTSSAAAKSASDIEAGSGIKSGAKSSLSQPGGPLVGLESLESAAAPTLELQPLPAPDLVSLDDLQSIGPLEHSVLPAGSSDLGAADWVLSSGVGLSPPVMPSAHASGAHAKKHDDGFSIPMPWIIAISCIAVVVVLAVLLMMIFGGGAGETAAVSLGAGAPSAPQPAVPAPPAPAEAHDVSSPPGESETERPIAPVSPPAESTPAAAPAEKATPPADSSPPKVPVIPAPTPATTPDSTPAASSVPAAPTTPTDVSRPADRPKSTPERKAEQPARATDQPSAKEMWDGIGTITVELDVPPVLTSQATGLKKAVEDKLSKTNVAGSEAAILHATYRVEPPRDRAARFPYSVAIRLTVTDQSGQQVEVWSDSKSDEATIGNYIDRMRVDGANLVSKMINTLGR